MRATSLSSAAEMCKRRQTHTHFVALPVQAFSDGGMFSRAVGSYKGYLEVMLIYSYVTLLGYSCAFNFNELPAAVLLVYHRNKKDLGLTALTLQAAVKMLKYTDECVQLLTLEWR